MLHTKHPSSRPSSFRGYDFLSFCLHKKSMTLGGANNDPGAIVILKVLLGDVTHKISKL
jgi:hypothetical protein